MNWVKQTDSGTPTEVLYVRIAGALRDEIVAGTFPIGSLLPTENELCLRFAVSRNTVREALRLLREDGFITSRRGAGSTVLPSRPLAAYAQDVNSISDLLALAKNMHREIDFIGMVVVDAELAGRTGLEAGEEWLAVLGTGVSDDSGVPICWAEYYIHRDFAAVGRLIQRQPGPIFPLIEDLFGERIEKVSQEISGGLIDARLAERLGAEPGSAALEVKRCFTLANGKIAQVTTSTYPAARYRHAMTIRRTRS
jgi:DNA-binding GntR family transcriptional regulator